MLRFVSRLCISGRARSCAGNFKHRATRLVSGCLRTASGGVVPGAKANAADAKMGIRYTFETNAAGLPKARSIAPASVYSAASRLCDSIQEARDAASGSGPETSLVSRDSIKFTSKVRKPCISDSAYI